MLFSSVEFIYLFLPIVIVGYFLCPSRWRNLLLLAVSLFFYAYGEPVYLFLMIGTILFDWCFGLILGKTVHKRAWLWVAVIFNLSLLGFFKYYPFLADNLGLPSLQISLPVGISFYTFQALSYVIDVYKDKVKPQKSIISFGTYISLFPQLVAGPIVQYGDIDKELKERTHSVSGFAEGLSVFCVGLSKKVLFANTAGEMYEAFSARSTTAAAWLSLTFFTFQIYYDFSGYSDMAVGLGKMLGFNFPKNFDYPYISKSITEFWRRWHITLSSWFREYVYIPLGGNRKGLMRTVLNLFIVWSLTGIWHGAEWNFLLWGIYFFLILTAEKLFLLRLLSKLPKIFCHCYALLFILLGWQIFAAEGGASEIFLSISALLPSRSHALISSTDGYDLFRNLPFLAIMAVGVPPLPKTCLLSLKSRLPRLFYPLRNSLALASIILCTAYLLASSYNPFLYFRF